ncbi:MAG: hypothetical protein LC808_31695, partial [Actinobacteria bacterium]|nr:hypothetical protein [Actinomycetota bacterium]
MSYKSKKSLLFGFTVGAVSVILGSTAYACITYRGDLTITGGSATSNLMTGANSGMSYCSGRNPTTPAAGKANTSVSIAVAPATACNTGGTNKLQDVLHDVRLRNGKYWTYSSSWTMISGTGCWASSPASGTLLGTFTPSSGSFSGGGFTIPVGSTANATNEASQF